ncbi:MAG: hypothetical protein Q9198_000913 [Flavoplaca austrocitrina]
MDTPFCCAMGPRCSRTTSLSRGVGINLHPSNMASRKRCADSSSIVTLPFRPMATADHMLSSQQWTSRTNSLHIRPPDALKRGELIVLAVLSIDHVQSADEAAHQHPEFTTSDRYRVIGVPHSLNRPIKYPLAESIGIKDGAGHCQWPHLGMPQIQPVS